jgi:hypothetical protein
MTDQDVRDFLERMVAEESAPFLDTEPLTHRARRRAARNVVIGALGVAAAIAVLITGASQLRGAPTKVPASPPPTVSSSSPIPCAERFDSALNGISIGCPSGWEARAAIEPWSGKIAFDAPDVDVIFDPEFRDDLYIAVVSEPLGSTSPGAWVVDQYTSRSLGVCYTGGSGGIGRGFRGNPAWFQSCWDPSDDQVREGDIVFFATPTRGYVIYLHVADKRRLQATYLGGWFGGDSHESGWLGTVELRPEDAVDTVNPSGSP